MVQISLYPGPVIGIAAGLIIQIVYAERLGGQFFNGKSGVQMKSAELSPQLVFPISFLLADFLELIEVKNNGGEIWRDITVLFSLYSVSCI